jgi:hypothetical protein
MMDTLDARPAEAGLKDDLPKVERGFLQHYQRQEGSRQQTTACHQSGD